MQTILITGASGLIGGHLINSLERKGHTVKTLTRSPFDSGTSVAQYYWDVEKNNIDTRCLEDVDTIIHLAGAGVAEKRWTADRKKELWESRTKSTQLLYDCLKNNSHQVKSFISTSAVGFYGDRGYGILTEKSSKGEGFLADLCEIWENEAMKIHELGIRVAIGRIGIVLAEEGGALPEMMKSVVLNAGGYFAKNPLFYPWVHVEDVVRAFTFLVENKKAKGIYNFTAPHPVSHKALMEAAIKAKGQNPVLVPTPKFALTMVLGEMADMLFNSQNCSAAKLQKAGFSFSFIKIEVAMTDLMNNQTLRLYKNIF